MTTYLSQIPIDDLVGLMPRAWLCVGPGFSREDVKAVLLEREEGLLDDAVTTLQDVARKLISVQKGKIPADRVLGSLARQEILKMLLGNRRISQAAGGLPELRKLRRQTGFFRKLDQAIQAGRLTFAHADEESVLLERLEQRLGNSAKRPVRDEIRFLAAAYEAWLRSKDLWDLPLLYAEATEILNSGWPREIAQPHSILLFSNQIPESRERAFCDALARYTDFRRVGQPEASISFETRATWAWSRWHTFDDAIEGLLDEIVQSGRLEDHVILISDQSSMRRSLNRALAERGIPQADPRDPTRIRWDEAIKWALLPLQVVASDFERASVISWLASFHRDSEWKAWVQEIQSRGTRQGLLSYSGGNLLALHGLLQGLQGQLGGKKTCGDLGQAHLLFLRHAAGADPKKAWIPGFFERVWNEFERDMRHLDQAERRAPLRYWLERLRGRIQETQPPVEPLKPAEGIAVYRLHQAPIRDFKSVWIFGLPPDWLGGESLGEYWFAERERQILGGEFAVRSGIQLRQERLQALCSWISGAESIQVFDSQYDGDGRERESLLPILRELSQQKLEAPQDYGAHPRWLASYGALRPIQSQEVRLEPRMTGMKPEITATALDHYSRCPFQALVYHRWKLRDGREPDSELWPEVRGNILHQAVKILLSNRNSEGGFEIGCTEALERGWKERPPKGLFKSKRIEAYAKARMVRVLEAFCDGERDYFSRSGARIVSLDDRNLRLEFSDLAVVGTPDRIDETDEALFIMDYKTSSAVPGGAEMLDYGYRLQLPFYGIAASREMRKPVAGVQFVQLTRQASRGSGMFFKRYNGKEPGKFTGVTARSSSLLNIEPEDAWSQMEERIHSRAQAFLAGRFDAKPSRKDPVKECVSCQLGDLCGYRRKIEKDESSEGGES